MTDEHFVEPEEEPDVEIDLAAPDQLAYDELCGEFGGIIDADLQEVVKQRIRSLFDNKEQLREMISANN